MKNFTSEILTKSLSETDIVSLTDLQFLCDNCITICKHNGLNPNNVPIIINNQTSHDKYPLLKNSVSYYIDTNNDNLYIDLGFYEHNVIDYNPKDERPEYGEYWQSRGPSDFDCSGFIKSKQAGERIMRYVHAILEKDSCETWLDWRKSEPTWIQLKFSAKEFDVQLLDKLTTENNGIITYEIMKSCKL